MKKASTALPEMSKTMENRWLIAILLLFALCCIGFNLATPYRTSAVYNQIALDDIGFPDEAAHANYIDHLIDKRSFPVMTAAPGVNYEAHQPPLYYLLAVPFALLGRWLGAEGFVLRLFSTCIGVFTLFVIYRTLRFLFPDLRMALGGTAFAGLLPMQVALFSSVSNDCLLELWFVMACYLAVKQIKSIPGSYFNPMLIVAICGLYTKTTAIILPVFLTLAVLLSKVEMPKDVKVNVSTWFLSRLRLGTAIIMFVLPYAVCLPWFIRNFSRYGDPLAMKIFKLAFAGTMTRSAWMSLGLSHYQYWVEIIGWYTYRTFWGAFGYLIPSWNLWLPSWLYGVCGVVSLAVLVGLGLYVIRQKTKGDIRWNIVLLTLLAMVALVFIQFNLTYAQGQARYFAIAITPIAYFAVVGLSQFFAERNRWLGGLVLGCFASFLSVYSLFSVIIPGYNEILGR